MTPHIACSEPITSVKLEQFGSILSIAKSTPVNFILPGKGNLGDNCGDVIRMYCESCGKHFYGKRSCLSRECPECCYKWAYIEGKKASYRVWLGRLYLWGKRGRILHCVVSFPKEIVITPDNLNEYRTRVYEICKKHGISGGCVVLHPWRKDDYGRYDEDGHHFHIIGLAKGNVLPGRKGDYVFRVFKDKEYGDYKGFRRVRSIGKCIKYEVEHCGICDTRHSLTWFGCLSYNSLSDEKLKVEYEDCYDYLVSEENESKYGKCPYCGSNDVHPTWIADYTAYPFDWVKWDAG